MMVSPVCAESTKYFIILSIKTKLKKLTVDFKLRYDETLIPSSYMEIKKAFRHAMLTLC